MTPFDCGKELSALYERFLAQIRRLIDGDEWEPLDITETPPDNVVRWEESMK